MPREVEVTLRFVVTDEELLMKKAQAAVERWGGGMGLAGSLEEMVVEVLLHSNPGVASYDEYGLALRGE